MVEEVTMREGPRTRRARFGAATVAGWQEWETLLWWGRVEAGVLSVPPSVVELWFPCV